MKFSSAAFGGDFWSKIFFVRLDFGPGQDPGILVGERGQSEKQSKHDFGVSKPQIFPACGAGSRRDHSWRGSPRECMRGLSEGLAAFSALGTSPPLLAIKPPF